jgi:hypothetical protein
MKMLQDAKLAAAKKAAENAHRKVAKAREMLQAGQLDGRLEQLQVGPT